jgi:putative membrane protein
MIFLRFVGLVAAFALMPRMLKGIRIKSMGTTIAAALVFSLLNFVLGWLLKVLLVVGTLGLAFLALNFLLNVTLLWLTDKLMPDVEIEGPGSLLMGALIITVCNGLLSMLIH